MTDLSQSITSQWHGSRARTGRSERALSLLSAKPSGVYLAVPWSPKTCHLATHPGRHSTHPVMASHWFPIQTWQLNRQLVFELRFQKDKSELLFVSTYSTSEMSIHTFTDIWTKEGSVGTLSYKPHNTAPLSFPGVVWKHILACECREGVNVVHVFTQISNKNRKLHYVLKGSILTWLAQNFSHYNLPTLWVRLCQKIFIDLVLISQKSVK